MQTLFRHRKNESLTLNKLLHLDIHIHNFLSVSVAKSEHV